MRKSSIYKLALSAAFTASMVGCLTQSAYNKNRANDSAAYEQGIIDINSRLDLSQKENASLQRELKRIRDMKVGIPAEAVMRVDRSLTETTINLSKLINRTDGRLRSDFEDRIVADFEASDDRLNKAREDIEKGYTDGIAAIDSSQNYDRGQLGKILDSKIDGVEANRRLNQAAIKVNHGSLENLTNALKKLTNFSEEAKRNYDTNVTNYEKKIVELERQVNILQEAKVFVPGEPADPNDPEDGTVRNPALTPDQLRTERDNPQEQVEIPSGRDLYICIVGRNFRYFSRHVARISNEDLTLVLNPGNGYLKKETAREINTLLSRNYEFKGVRNQTQLDKMLSSPNSPIVEISREALENICQDNKLLVVDSGINRNSIATIKYVLGHARGRKKPTFYVTAH